MTFKSYSNRPGRMPHSACPTCRPTYIKDKLTNKLVESGKEDRYAYIQSFAESCTLSYKLRQFNSGNPMALGTPGGVYGDFTDAPSSYQAVLEQKNKLQNSFEALPSDIKERFGNSYDKFVESVNDGSIGKILGSIDTGVSAGTAPGTAGEPGTNQTGTAPGTAGAN